MLLDVNCKVPPLKVIFPGPSARGAAQREDAAVDARNAGVGIAAGQGQGVGPQLGQPQGRGDVSAIGEIAVARIDAKGRGGVGPFDAASAGGRSGHCPNHYCLPPAPPGSAPASTVTELDAQPGSDAVPATESTPALTVVPPVKCCCR